MIWQFSELKHGWRGFNGDRLTAFYPTLEGAQAEADAIDNEQPHGGFYGGLWGTVRKAEADAIDNEQPHPALTGEGYTCGVCGRGFTQAEWDDRHDNEDEEDAYFHAGCCPICGDTTPEEWQRIAYKYERESKPSAISSAVSFVPGEPKPYPSGDILPNGHATEYSPVRLAVTPVAQRPLTVTECEAAIARYLERHGQPDDPAMQRVLLDGLDIKDMTPVIREDRTITHDTFKNARRRIADELDRQIHAARKAAEIDRSQRTLRLSYAQVRSLYAYLLIKGLGPNEGDERVGRAMDPSPEDFEAAFEVIRRAALYAPESSR